MPSRVNCELPRRMTSVMNRPWTRRPWSYTRWNSVRRRMRCRGPKDCLTPPCPGRAEPCRRSTTRRGVSDPSLGAASTPTGRSSCSFVPGTRACGVGAGGSAERFASCHIPAARGLRRTADGSQAMRFLSNTDAFLRGRRVVDRGLCGVLDSAPCVAPEGAGPKFSTPVEKTVEIGLVFATAGRQRPALREERRGESGEVE
jgi:hypothetical protein